MSTGFLVCLRVNLFVQADADGEIDAFVVDEVLQEERIKRLCTILASAPPHDVERVLGKLLAMAESASAVAVRLSSSLTLVNVALQQLQGSQAFVRITSLKLITTLYRCCKNPRMICRLPAMEDTLIALSQDGETIVAQELASNLVRAFHVHYVM